MLTFRPHHFLCTLGFKGLGYTDDFVTNYQEICTQLMREGGDNTLIEVTETTDDICTACPQKQGPLCQQQNKIESLDQRHANALNLKPGDEITWLDAKRRIASNISDATFHKICGGCRWKELGTCLEALHKNRALVDEY